MFQVPYCIPQATIFTKASLLPSIRKASCTSSRRPRCLCRDSQSKRCAQPNSLSSKDLFPSLKQTVKKNQCLFHHLGYLLAPTSQCCAAPRRKTPKTSNELGEQSANQEGKMHFVDAVVRRCTTECCQTTELNKTLKLLVNYARKLCCDLGASLNKNNSPHC